MSDQEGASTPFDLFASAQQVLAAQAQAAQQTVEGSAGGGVVKVQMTGLGEVVGVTLAPEVVAPEDVEMLQDLILAAIRDATTKVADLTRDALGGLGQIDFGAIGQMLGPGPGAGLSDERPGESPEPGP